jgi:hypothetical protein
VGPTLRVLPIILTDIKGSKADELVIRVTVNPDSAVAEQCPLGDIIP